MLGRPTRIVFGLAFLVVISCATKPEESEAPLAAAAPCMLPFGWWESPDLMPLFADPKGPAPVNPCDFELWAWTALVHFMRNDPQTQLPSFLSLNTAADFGSAVTTGPRKLTLKPRVQKPEQAADIEQAGSNGILVDQNGRAIYYSSHFDPLYFGFAKQYYGVANFQKATPTLNFPVGATALKAAWRVVEEGEDSSGLFTTKADIAKLADDPKRGVIATGDLLPNRTVALIGVHIVSVLKDHPEFAWATFEHPFNAPNLPAGMDPHADQAVSSASFLLYAAGTSAKDCNSLPSPQAPITVDPATQICSPKTPAFRQFQYGGADASTQALIAALTKDMQAGIGTHAQSAKIDAVFANYFLVGTVWQKAHSLKPNDGNMNQTAIGSTSLMNATMETYVQGRGESCFSCHNTAGHTGTPGKSLSYPGKNINTSHILLSPFFPPPKAD